MSKWFQNSGRSEWSDRSQLCIFAISCYLCQLTLWVGPLKKQHAPTNKMLGSDLILFWDLPDFFFKGVLPPHSLEVHHTRMILLVNCRELCNSCNQQLQPTAWQLRPISRHIASMKDQDGSGTSAYTGCKKKRGNIQIKPIRAMSLWASIIASHNKNGFPTSGSLCVFFLIYNLYRLRAIYRIYLKYPEICSRWSLKKWGYSMYIMDNWKNIHIQIIILISIVSMYILYI